MKRVWRLLKVMPLIFIAVASCSDCDDMEKKVEKFDDGYKQAMPFSGYEVLTFLRDGKDTVRFTGKGREFFYETVERAGGDCAMTCDLPTSRVNFSNSSDEKKIVFKYFKYSSTNAFTDYFQVELDNSVLGPITNFDLYEKYPPRMIKILVKEYPYVKWFGFGNDSLYLNFADGDLAKYKIVRMKHQDHIYELIP